MRARFRNGEQSPVPCCLPFALKLELIFFEQFALRGIVDEHDVLRLVQARHYDVVQRRGGFRFERGDERSALRQFALKIGHLARKGKSAKAVLLEIAHDRGGVDAVGAVGIQGVEDPARFGLRLRGRPWCRSQYCMTMAMLAAPQPSFCCGTNGTSSQRFTTSAAGMGTEAARIALTMAAPIDLRSMGWPSVHRDNDKDESSDQDEDDQQVVVTHAAGSKVVLSVLRAGGELRQFLITEARDCFLYFLRIHVGGLQSLLRLVGGEEAVQSVGVLLAGLGGINGGLLQL